MDGLRPAVKEYDCAATYFANLTFGHTPTLLGRDIKPVHRETVLLGDPHLSQALLSLIIAQICGCF